MSNRGVHPEAAQRHSHTDSRRRPHRPPSPQPQTDPASYAIVHGNRQVRVGPVVFWIVVGAVVLLGAWSAATATYFAFRDDVLTRILARQAEMQFAYEDTIAELRARVDRTASRQLLDQEQFDQKLEQVMRRQAMLENRASVLSSLPDIGVTGSIRSPRAEAPSHKPSPISDTAVFIAPPDREARLESRSPTLAPSAPTQFAKAQGVDTVIGKLQSSLDQVEKRQLAAMSAVEESYEQRARRMKSVLADLGLDLPLAEAPMPRGVGGPFVPIKGDTAFERQLTRISLSRAQVERLNRTLALVPYRKPVIGEVEFTSGFGVRSDPFLGRPAMHTGLDFRAGTGDPVRATAAGKVIASGWSGGYGRMVEIDHGNGLSTRYGHLSEIHVKVGDAIRIGQVIGAVGSTGRSTGPHLHYETRIEGEAVDPQKFLRAGVRLAGAG